MGLANSAVLRLAAQAGLPTVTEGFVDRAYNTDGSLVSRLLPGAVLHDVELVAARAVRLVTNRTVIAIDGSEIEVDFDSLCVHGDTPDAVQIAGAVRVALAAANIGLRPFAT